MLSLLWTIFILGIWEDAPSQLASEGAARDPGAVTMAGESSGEVRGGVGGRTGGGGTGGESDCESSVDAPSSSSDASSSSAADANAARSERAAATGAASTARRGDAGDPQRRPAFTISRVAWNRSRTAQTEVSEGPAARAAATHKPTLRKLAPA